MGIKIFVPAAVAGIVVGGGGGFAYHYYKKSDKANGSTQSTTPLANNIVQPFETNLFIGRVKTTPSSSTNITQPVSCKIDESTTVSCTVWKFTAPQSTNNIATFKYSTLSSVTTPQTDLTTNTLAVVELHGKKLNLSVLKNKTIEVKTSATEATKIVDLDFDQPLKPKSSEGWTAETDLEVIEKNVDTYIVETKSVTTGSVAAVEPTKYRCKYPATSSGSNLVNYDDSCKLIAIPTPTTPTTIVGLSEIKSASTLVAKTGNTAPAVNKFFKLEVDANKLYNLDFDSSATGDLTVEIISNDATTPAVVGTFALKQKLVNESFIGKTNLILAKVSAEKTDVDGTVSTSKCNFTKGEVSTGQFDCSLYLATEDSTNSSELHKLTIALDATTTAGPFTSNKYFVIKLNNPIQSSHLTKDKKIYYQITKTGQNDKHESVELEVVQLLSGDIGTSKTPLYISNYTN